MVLDGGAGDERKLPPECPQVACLLLAVLSGGHCHFLGVLRGMAARGESQQWYIEEIPAVEQDDGSSEEECGRPSVSAKSEADDIAPKAFITLDMGAAATLDTPQSKVGATVRRC